MSVVGEGANHGTRGRVRSPSPLNRSGLQKALRFSAVKSFFVFLAFFAVVLLTSSTAFAQWQTQTITVKPGWNAVYLHVDASHVTLDASVGAVGSNPITEVWLWNPTMAPDRFINNPQQPVSGNDWTSWNRANSPASTLVRLIGNSAYLVKNGGTVDYTWSIQGKPVPPRYEWTSKGVNLIGFATPASSPPFFSTFLGPAQRLASGGEFFRYDDGNNDLTPSLFNALFNTVRVTRGQAYWIRNANEFNRYFGAFEIALQNSSGIHFGASGSQYSLRVRNTTPGNITLTLALLPSEAAPSGQTAVAGLPPLLRRGDLSVTDLTYSFTTFSPTAQTVTLKPKGQVGSEAEIILGVNRVAMTGNPGDLYAGILRLTDSLGYTQIDLPVSASPASSSGLWVGNALVSQVRHYLKNYQRDSKQQPVLAQIQQSIAGSDTSGLLLEMRLDEGSGTIAKNSAPPAPFLPRATRLDLTPVSNPVSPLNAFGQLPAGDYFIAGSGFTIESWVFVRSYRNGARLFDFGNANGQNSVSLVLSAGAPGPALFLSDGGALQTAAPLPLNQWLHLAVVFSVTGTDAIYINGVASQPSNIPPPTIVPRANVFVGRSSVLGEPYPDVQIDDFRIWSVARTPQQLAEGMASIYPAGTSGLLAQYHFGDEATVGNPTTAADTSGNGRAMSLNNATIKRDSPTPVLGSLNNGPAWLPGKSGPPTSSERPTLTFNSATQQFVELNDGPVLGNPFTQEAWIYSTAQDTALHGFLGYQDASGNRAPSLSVFETNIIRFAYTDVAGTQLSASTARLSLILSNWNHVATTYDGTTLKIYVNGLVQLNEDVTFAGKPPKALPVKWVGRAQDSYFQGRIAGVRLWNVVRSQEQIQQSMNRPALTPTLGQYIVTSTNSSLGSVARPFNLRLIVHKSTTETRLLQRAYYGLDQATNTVVATRESLLHPALLSSARRISAVHLPFSDANAGWAFTGQFAQGQALSAQVNLAFGDYASNPFLHGFHPDHDNLNATFDATEPRGVESYDSERKLTLTFTPPGNDFSSLVSGGNQMTGQYSEEITLKGRGNESRRIDTAGFFVLKRISDIGTLTTQ